MFRACIQESERVESDSVICDGQMFCTVLNSSLVRDSDASDLCTTHYCSDTSILVKLVHCCKRDLAGIQDFQEFRNILRLESIEAYLKYSSSNCIENIELRQTGI